MASIEQDKDLELKNNDLRIHAMRTVEYPMLKDNLYLDHAGTTLYAKSLVERFSQDMMSNLLGNPHSLSPASQNATRLVEDVRLRLLNFVKADPAEFDLVFVANATAGIKLVTEAFRDAQDDFWYGYHRDCHTSMIGVREVASHQRCFENDQAVEKWISNGVQPADGGAVLRLFGYPAQSNMNGRRLPLEWCQRIRQKGDSRLYTLLDAAALVSTSPLDLSVAGTAPDFTVISLYKIFGFPDLGALIVRKASQDVFQQRRYFGGGTVEMVVNLKDRWHARKEESLHDRLEDGTLPIHSILALNTAMDVHRSLFTSMSSISLHCAFLAQTLFGGVSALKHGNGLPVCKIYIEQGSSYSDPRLQGPIVAFNILNSLGGWVSNAEVEKLAAVRNISIRIGGLCNPGGIASSLNLEPWEMKRNFSAGQRCGNENDIMHGKPTGVIRVSLGAMSTLDDVRAFLEFMQEFFVDEASRNKDEPASIRSESAHFTVESLTVYPIKSCAGYRVPAKKQWQLHKEGLAWDREWCLVRPGSMTALNQKRYPQMAKLRPSIDLDAGLLRVQYTDSRVGKLHLAIPLAFNPTIFNNTDGYTTSNARVCGDAFVAQIYASKDISRFFTEALGVECQLARFPPTNSGASLRHAKAHLQPHQMSNIGQNLPGAFPSTSPTELDIPRPILLSNESPILVITRSSLNRLNEQIKATGGKAVHAEAFRANIVIEESNAPKLKSEQPYIEDTWRLLQIGSQHFQILGSCRRCQMVCIDQESGVRSDEPFATLAKTRRFDGKVYFGQHVCHIQAANVDSPLAQNPTIAVGDRVQPLSMLEMG